jgi:ubiquitin-conjugating enzyme E2 Z
MLQRKIKRISGEIKELEESRAVLKENGIYFHYNEEDMNKIYAMLVGQKDTPYENGFYFFTFEYPDKYPMQPPLATYCTQGSIKGTKNISPIRFNPNLYTCGKVCLSMLNTWNGPGWVPTNTISNVLIAIQALVLAKHPLKNEPGFETADPEVLKKYDNVIEYANIKIAVLEMLEQKSLHFDYFKEPMKENFLKNVNFYKSHIDKKKVEFGEEKLLDSGTYGMKIMIDYDKIKEMIEEKEKNLNNL